MLQELDIYTASGASNLLGYKDQRTFYCMVFRNRMKDPDVALFINGRKGLYWSRALIKKEETEYTEYKDLFDMTGAAKYMGCSRQAIYAHLAVDGRMEDPIIIRINGREKRLWKKEQLDRTKKLLRKRSHRRKQQKSSV